MWKSLLAAAIAAGAMMLAPVAFAQELQAYAIADPSPGLQYATPTTIAAAEAELTWRYVFDRGLALAGTLIVSFIGVVYARDRGVKQEHDDMQLLQNNTDIAIGWGRRATPGVPLEGPLNAEQAAQVAEEAWRYSERMMPTLVAGFGGQSAQRLRIWARMPLLPDVVMPARAPRDLDVEILKPTSPPAASPPAPPLPDKGPAGRTTT